MKPWKFYGRRRETVKLDGFMEGHSIFDAMIVRGRRQVGKSHLMRDFFGRLI